MTDKRMLLIVNPRSGRRRGLAVLEQVKPVFAAGNVELDVRVTEHSGHARQIVQEFDLARYDGLCLVGGDGTVHEAVSGLLSEAVRARSHWGSFPAGLGTT
jgi:diacylglycerol kinase family enzyme